MKLRINIKGKEYDVEITGDEADNKVKIIIGGKEFAFDMDEKIKEEEASVARTVMPKRDLSKKEIKASLAGVISDIFVKEGEVVKNGQKILTLSAMKMENEIVSELEGKIKKISVKKGQKVKEGEILIVLS